MRKYMTLFLACLFLFQTGGVQEIYAAQMTQTNEQQELNTDTDDILTERMALYQKYEVLTMVPWYYLAAIDQYERNIQEVRNDLEPAEGLIAIQFDPHFWSGTLNPNPDDKQLQTIHFFGGSGLDGNGDGLADWEDDEDILFTMSQYISRYGFTEKDFRIALWEYYQNETTVEVITAIAAIYRKYQSIEFGEKAFPLDIRFNYSYHNTWGDRRGWGGRRIHEGTDLFADYGTPVRSTTYGKICVMGWNRYGGWRVGIRDVGNNYHYYAHLSRFEEGIEEGDVIEPGTVIGYVGNTGYGKEGTSGKFPPHLHYGMYKYNGRIEWSYDPYPSLRMWEKKERQGS